MPLASRTSVRVGGPADLFVRPADEADLIALLAAARRVGQPVHVLGGGANTLIGDLGIRGITLKLLEEEELLRDAGEWLEVELSAGAPSARLAQLAKDHGLLGLEWAAGIPGTVGGMTAMNAGTRTGEMKDNLVAARLVTADGAAWVDAKDLHFAYRHAELRGAIASTVRVRLRKGTPTQVAASLAAMDKDRAYRKSTQPLHLPNSGSVFRNPPGHHAGALIESCGLKGSVAGGAQISDLHANFIVNRGGATAADVITLMARAVDAVRAKHAITLALEVRCVGQFAPSTELTGLLGRSSVGAG